MTTPHPPDSSLNTSWQEALTAVRALRTTLDKVERQLRSPSAPPDLDPLKEFFGHNPFGSSPRRAP